ncbi:cysteine-rich repeat secretory protein 55-like [Phalaenopsis equestris]|uniref:cysteine-rich repeat secretory protein 55-like n=1 Tax=Phalaenopsis equestris TaxID=78828 RepID=UPI0009E30008|nr:cysteine-rich repeat secretory protein 55-like [Phalaenopsis equestris]
MDFAFKLFILSLLPILGRCSTDLLHQECHADFNIFTNPNMKQNIDHVISDLLVKTTRDGYAIASYGSGSDAIHGLTQCRGDINLDACSACILEATHTVQANCPFSADARLWYKLCFIRYSSNNFFGQLDTSYANGWASNKTADDPVDFNKVVTELLEVIKITAATRDNKFARGNSNSFKNNMIIYGMAQCTRDLQEQTCKQCLDEESKIMSKSCYSRFGCDVFNTDCRLKYENFNFLVGPAA